MIDILYVDTDQVRAALHLAPEDLPDDRFHADMLERGLQLDLDGWLPTHAAVASQGATAAQRRLAALLQSYCVGWLALRTLLAAPLALPSAVGDGKNSIKRAPDADSPRLLAEGAMLGARRALEKEVNSVTLPVGSQLAYDTPAYDPVTG